MAEVSQQMALFLIDRLHDHTIETYAIYWPTADAMTKAQFKIF